MVNTNSNHRTLLRRVTFGFIIGVFIFIIMAVIADIRQVSQVITQFKWQYFLFAIGFAFLNYCLRFLKWHFYLYQIGIRSISWAESARLFVAGFPLAITPGKVGEALKGVWLQQRSTISVAKGISVVVAERISDGLAVLFLSTLGIFAYPQYWLAFLLIFTLLMLVIIISQIRPLSYWLLNLAGRLPLISRFSNSMKEFYEGSFALYKPGSTILAVTIGIISWLGEGIGCYLIFVGLGLDPSFKLAAEAVFIHAFSTVVGAASALPGGLGAAEASIAGMITLIINPPAATTVSATFLIRLSTLWLGVAVGLITWSFSGDLLGMKSDDKKIIQFP